MENNFENFQTFSDQILDLLIDLDSYQSPYAKAVGDLEEIITPLVRSYCMKSVAISSVSSILPGLIGGLAVVPEAILLIKLQSRLVKDIAILYGKEKYLTKEIILYCLFKQSRIDLFEKTVKMTGTRMMFRSFSLDVLQILLKKIGFETEKRGIFKYSKRAASLIGSVLGGAVSYADTRIVGTTAKIVFSKEIHILEDSDEI
ncbi:MAG: hypothetical protein H7A24_14420 [Leptospiraceae bacterium]|nr:hypothetical protein [Leptospiraceae bacterium]MCP5513077.1 hypothetical protein [Leptospiraceae bacterium]